MSLQVSSLKELTAQETIMYTESFENFWAYIASVIHTQIYEVFIWILISVSCFRALEHNDTELVYVPFPKKRKTYNISK